MHVSIWPHPQSKTVAAVSEDTTKALQIDLTKGAVLDNQLWGYHGKYEKESSKQI
jgi:hypothetical protein